ncbi:MAG TPA: exodeoxyribonuclease V subunit gamma [Clostridiaceae bacterium]|nr:exodeoxyribonuclease V subunit gamma [Clostridiaceae bacterium]
MSLRLVYGRAGKGKSSFLYNEIKDKINEKSKIYIITPEQFSFTAEKKLMDAIGTGAVINAEVLTFNRMAYRVLKEIGGINKTDLSKCGRAMLIYDILSKNKRKLKYLGKSDENIDMIGTQITEFKKHGVSVEELEEAKNNAENKYLKCKMEDMFLVYNEFQNRIIDKFIDETDRLSMLANKIDETEEFNNSLIYIDEFVGFTKQEYDIIRKLLKVAKMVSITICADNLEEIKNPDTDIFYSNKQTAQKIINLAKDEKIKIENEIKIDSKNARFKAEELKHIEESLYNIPLKKYEKDVENVKLFLANNPYSEIEHLAIQIVKLVRNEKYRYKDISIITKNLDTYSNLCKAIFHKYDIPIFIDEKKDLNNNILIQYILSILEIFSKNWSHESVFNYIKTGLLDIDEQEIYKLENYCLRWGIKQNKWYGPDWNYTDDTKKTDDLKRINELKNTIVNPLMELKNEINKSKDVTTITKCLYDFLIKMEIDKKIENKIERLAENNMTEIAMEYETSWKVLVSVLDEIVLIFGGDKVTFEQYKQIMKIGFKNSGLGKIPASQDQVIIGDVERSKTHKVKAIFMIGLNDRSIPKCK